MNYPSLSLNVLLPPPAAQFESGPDHDWNGMQVLLFVIWGLHPHNKQRRQVSGVTVWVVTVVDQPQGPTPSLK